MNEPLPLPAGDGAPADLIPAKAAAKLVPSPRPGRGTHLSTLHRWVNTGKLRGWKLGRWLHVSRAELLALLRPAPAPARPAPARAETAADLARRQAEVDRQLDELGL